MTDKTDSYEIVLPCPFCGGMAEIIEVSQSEYAVECSACGSASGIRVSAMEDARPLVLEDWNRRATAPGPQLGCPDWKPIVAKIAHHVTRMNRDTITANEHGNAVAADCEPLFEALGMNFDEGWGFPQSTSAAVIPPVFTIGEQVEKYTGDYTARGEVRAVFAMKNGAIRFVVEHQAEGGGSFCHIYSEKNLRKVAP